MVSISYMGQVKWSALVILRHVIDKGGHKPSRSTIPHKCARERLGLYSFGNQTRLKLKFQARFVNKPSSNKSELGSIRLMSSSIRLVS